MKGQELRSAFKARMGEEYAQNPSLLQGKKLIGCLLLLWIVTRVFSLVMELVCAQIGFIDSNPTNVIGLLTMLLFAWGIYRGFQALAWLPLLGGVFMLITCLREDYFFLLTIDQYIELRLYLLAYIASAVVQLAVMGLLLLLPPCRAYSQTAARVIKELNGQAEGPHL